MIRCKCAAFLALLVLAACDADPNFWNPETCNQKLEGDVNDLELYQTEYKDARKKMEEEARRGNTEAAEANKRAVEDWKKNIATRLGMFDNELLKNCKKEVLRSDLLQKIDAARQFLNTEGAVSSVGAEGMPDLRVTAVESALVPYEVDEYGSCNGPYVNLTFTVTNYGADFPRPIDLQTYKERTQQPDDASTFFTVLGELDFGGGVKKSLNVPVKGALGNIPSGGSIKVPAKILVENNQMHAQATGSVAETAFLKTGNSSAVPYETSIDIPLWDIYTESHLALGKKDEADGKYYILTMAIVSNKGKTPTPGPIQGGFIIYNDETGNEVTSWTGKTEGPVADTAKIFAKTFSTKDLPPKIRVATSIVPLCPTGNTGTVNDGDTKNNTRELKEGGAATSSNRDAAIKALLGQ